MHFTKFLISAVLLVFCGQSFGQLSEQHYRIYSTNLGREVDLKTIIDEMKNRDVLLFGEEHNDSVAHYLESRILELLYAEWKGNVALSLEMFERDVQLVMNEYLSGSIREKNFTKDSRAWKNYRDYKPMVEFAKTNKIDVVCSNAPGRYTNLAGRKGQKALMELPEESKRYFAPLPYDTASGKYYEKLMDLTAHGPAPTQDTSRKDTSGKAALPVMNMGGFSLIQGQSLWDATMAYSIFEYLNDRSGKKVFHVNGRFHSDEGLAVVTQLQKYNPKLRPLVISSGPDESFPNIDWSKFRQLGDFVIITDPKVPRTYEE